MALYSIQQSFAAGELSPSLYGRTDLAKWHIGASTMRNFFVNFRGGASSRAGTAYVGMCKQGAPNAGGTATDNPPRDIRFQFNINQGYALEFGDEYMRIKSDGAYITETSVAITGITQAPLGVVTAPSHGYSAGDWVFISGIVGMTELNGQTWIIQNPTTDTFTLTDLFGTAVDTTNFDAYVSGGASARIYTISTPYAAVDLQWLKFTQSADTMSLTCVNQDTGTEYPPYELVRNGAANWSLSEARFDPAIDPPTGVTVSANTSTTVSTYYSYVVTSVDRDTGQESIASQPGTVENNDIAVNQGSNVITWNPVTNANSYNVYKATPSYDVPVQVGSSYGYAGTALAPAFTDQNITADFTTVPPTHQNPFARGTILFVNITNQGSGYSQSSVGYTITTSTGTLFQGTPVVLNGKIVSMIVAYGGENYASGDTIAFTGGTGATGTLVIGPQSGTYPGVVSYFQERRVYAASLNNPDTYWMSQPGNYDNFDSAIPVSDSDAITGTPWALQVNGIQAMVSMPSGLVVLTGSGAWQVAGTGSNPAITPSNQSAAPQAYNGISAFVPPIPINYDILYVQSKGSIIRDLAYNFFVNIYTGTDMTVLSDHLFSDYTISQWAWAEEPYKIVWTVRSDGILLSFTFLKEQDVYGWARHDTNGLFVGVCSVTEPPVDAIYLIVKRYIRDQWVYYSERMDNRLWSTVEEAWCVDCGLSYPMEYPDATLIPSASSGPGEIDSVEIISGGTAYTDPVVIAVDSLGSSGSGAEFSVTLDPVTKAISSVSVVHSGSGYTFPKLQVVDATGYGAVLSAVVSNEIAVSASSSIFTAGNIGDVIRVGGGSMVVTAVTDGQNIMANVTSPITEVLQNNPANIPVPATSGTWSISTPTTTVSGLGHLEGQTVAILADGSVVPQQTVTNGSITLPEPASQITVGLPFQAQLQTLYLEPPGQPVTTQGRRKNIWAVTARVQETRGISAGINQIDAATTPASINVEWSNMTEEKERTAQNYPGRAIPLFTGDVRIVVKGDWETPGQIAIEQNYPLPANILALVPEWVIGDTPG